MPLFYGRDVVYTSSLSFSHVAVSDNGPVEKPDMSMLKAYANIIEREGWNHVDATPVTDYNKITDKLALFIVSIVGFNIPMSWSEPRYDENGRFSVQAMILEVALRGSQIPRWAYYLGISNLKIIDEADTRFEQFMRERLAGCETQLRKLHDAGGASNTEIAESIKDIFGGLVNARVSEGKLTLSDEEIIGNCFVFVFAGHGTVPRLIAASVANLHQWVYDSITSVLGDRIPTFEDYNDLTGVLSCIYEALRLYPAVYMMGKHTARDFIFALPRCDKPVIIEEIFVKKGTPVHLVLIGMLYDLQTYPDPESFKPERWIDALSPQASGSSTITRDTAASEVSASSSASTHKAL
ncbi:hypothetical protein ACEPAF_7367 [Sanghuangporus sanghuang]